jgi:uncharacterized protein (UPF0128 family)
MNNKNKENKMQIEKMKTLNVTERTTNYTIKDFREYGLINVSGSIDGNEVILICNTERGRRVLFYQASPVYYESARNILECFNAAFKRFDELTLPR